MSASGDDHQHDEATDDRTPDRQATAPDLHRAEEAALCPVVTREQVVHPRPNDPTDHHRNGESTDLVRIVPLTSPATLRDRSGRQDTERQHQSVGVQRHRPDVHDAVRRTRNGREDNRHNADHRHDRVARRDAATAVIVARAGRR